VRSRESPNRFGSSIFGIVSLTGDRIPVFLIRTLSQFGDRDTVEELQRHTEDSALGSAAVNSIRAINSRLDKVGRLVGSTIGSRTVAYVIPAEGLERTSRAEQSLPRENPCAASTRLEYLWDGYRSTNPSKEWPRECSRPARQSGGSTNRQAPSNSSRMSWPVGPSAPLGTSKESDPSGGLSFEELQREQHTVDADADFEFSAQRFNGVAKSAE
jgi:hypothetical protein